MNSIVKAPEKKWFYPLISAPLFLLMLLPMPVLYLLSDFLRLLVVKVFAYRKKVVLENLRNSFPDKDEKWIEDTAWKFYQNLFDVILETLKMLTISKSELAKRIKLNGPDLIESYQLQKQSFILVGGHNGNWEWGGQHMHNMGYSMGVLYHPLSSKWFDWLMYFQRTRFGLQPIPMSATLKVMLAFKQEFYCYAFIADQTPSSENCHWMEFLHQDTPVFMGPEKIAKKFNYPVVFCDLYRVGRGYYELNYKLVTDSPKDEPDFAITEKHTRFLEQQILKQPEAWLWSHRRWKHKRKASSDTN
ncbi:MAG: lysophospholipid acyltransferase family protein [Bacteroidia bacterium]